MRRTAIIILASCGLLLTGFADRPAIQAATQSARDAAIEGRWAVRLEGKPVVIVELRRDAAAAGGWSGSYSAAQLRMTEEHSFSNVQGPGGTRPITSTRWTRGGTLAFTVEGHRDRYTFKAVGDGPALLGWQGVEVKPLVAHRAGADEVIPAEWEAGKIYATEDGHR